MIDEKIPREEREHMLLLADGNHILWIIGHRISDNYKVSEATRRVLVASVRCEMNEREYNQDIIDRGKTG